MKVAAFYENIKDGAKAKNISIKQALSQLKEEGMDLLYMARWSFEEDREELLPMMEELGIQMEGMYDFLDFSHNPKEEQYKKSIEYAKETGATNVLLLPGVIMPEEAEKAEELTANMIEGMKTAVSYGEKMGVKVSLEDFDGMVAPYNTIEGMLLFMNGVPGLYCSFDTGNFIMYHQNEMEAFEQLRDRLCTMHMKDRGDQPHYPNDQFKTCADGAKCYPSPVGYGTIPMKEIIAKLKEQGYEGNLIAEMYDCDPDHMLEGIAKSVQWMKEQIS